MFVIYSLRDQLSLGLLESPFSMFHNMGLCSRPGGGPGPNAWKHFGPELDPGVRALHKAPGRRGILEGGLRGGGPGLWTLEFSLSSRSR
jgi:hypothetical protein